MRLATQSDFTTATIHPLIMSTYLSSLLNDYRSIHDTNKYKYSIQLSNSFSNKKQPVSNISNNRMLEKLASRDAHAKFQF